MKNENGSASVGSALALPISGWIHLDGWDGRSREAVTVIRKTRTRYECRNDGPNAIKVSGRYRWLQPGETVMAPKYAVTFDVPDKIT